MDHSTKKLLVIAALGTLLAAPAFAQQAPNARRDAQARAWTGRPGCMSTHRTTTCPSMGIRTQIRISN